MAKFYQTTEFRHLDAEWNKKLVETDFKDAERSIGSTRVLKQRSSYAYRRHARTPNQEAKEVYFTLILQNIHTTSFDKELDQLVLSKFAEGLNNVAIVRELTALGLRIHRKTVMFIVRRYEHLWGLRFWTAKKRNLKSG